MRRIVSCLVCAAAMLCLMCSCGAEEVHAEEKAIAVELVDDDASYTRLSDIILAVNHVYGKRSSPQMTPNTTEGRHQFEALLRDVMQRGYPLIFDMGTIAKTAHGFCVEVRKPLDVYGERITLWVEYSSVQRGELVIAASTKGRNGNAEFSGWPSIRDEEQSDDLYLYVLAQHAAVAAA